LASPTLPKAKVDAIVDLALDEDVGRGDVTSDILIDPGLEGRADILIKGTGILAGMTVAEAVFRRVDPSLKVDLAFDDGAAVKPGDVVGSVRGRVVSILKGERVALNLLQRASGIASLTAQYVTETRGTKAGIYDTRKTTPGLRFLEKHAVRMGGGHNHRLDLGDFILIKDNHIAILRGSGLSLTEIVTKAKRGAPEGMTVEVEVTSFEDALEAAHAGADIVMFDNMTPEEMRRAAEALPKGVRTEASGGINLATVRAAALSGVDIISVGALTHSPKVLDISLELGTARPSAGA